MHAFGRISTAAALTAALSGGCDPGDPRPEETARGVSADTVLNGVSFNGVSFNGVSFNGSRLDGVRLEPLQLANLHLDGHALSGVSLVGSVLSGTRPGGAAASGSALAGAELPATLSDGTHLTLHLDAVAASPIDPALSLYTVSTTLPGSAARHPLCGLDAAGAPVQAIPLEGSWDESAGTPTGGAHLEDPTVFTFACNGHALAKCVELGYAPWATVTECRTPGTCHALSLAPFHQACTRMLRADYCGDGTPTTRDGTLVDVWDDEGIQGDEDSAWAFEGEWGEGGATCVMSTRWPTVTDAGESVQTFIHDHCPSRWKTTGCGGSTSAFFTPNGFSTPLTSRPLLRTRITHPNG